MTIRLTKSNFLLWRAQLLPCLRGLNLMGFIDGSVAVPAKEVPSSNDVGAPLVPNPAYTTWYNEDQQVLSGLLSTMKEEVLSDVVAATTSKEAWDIIKKMFSSSTRARIVQIRVELATTKKRDLSAAAYFSKIKSLASELTAADAPLRDDEVVAYLLAGLGSDYDPFVTSITTKTEALSLDDVYAHLLTFEAHQLQHQEEARLHIGRLLVGAHSLVVVEVPRAAVAVAVVLSIATLLVPHVAPLARSMGRKATVPFAVGIAWMLHTMMTHHQQIWRQLHHIKWTRTGTPTLALLITLPVIWTVSPCVNSTMVMI